MFLNYIYYWIWLQWGRTFSSADNAILCIVNISENKLQWGRTFSSADKQAIEDAMKQAEEASMGPHFFKCG